MMNPTRFPSLRSRVSTLCFGLCCLLLYVGASRPAQAQTTEKVLHAFNSVASGSVPSAGLIQGTDGNFYGVNSLGGDFGYGEVFQLTPSHVLTPLHAFSTRQGYNEHGALLQASDGRLYGVTNSGGPNNLGTLYSLATDGSDFQVVHSFTQADGFSDVGVIQGSDGLLYGTTYGGNALYGGAVYRVAPDGTGFKIVHRFSNSDRYYLYAGVIQGRDGLLYGVTSDGGSPYGTVYRVATDGSGFRTIHSFGAILGGTMPYFSLLQGRDGALYGTTEGGGTNSDGGVAFRLNTDGSHYTVLHNFDRPVGGSIIGSTGGIPAGGLIQGADGALYGATEAGGLSDHGVLFKISADGHGYQVLHEIGNVDAVSPFYGLLLARDGKLYGAAGLAFTNGPRPLGLVFSMHTDGSNFTTFFDFANAPTDGINPSQGNLTLGPDGLLYGATIAGGAGAEGTLYRSDPATGATTVLRSFSARFNQGSFPNGDLVVATDGTIYGATRVNNNAYSAVYRYVPATSTYTELHQFYFPDPAGYSLQAGLVKLGNALYGVSSKGSSTALHGTLFQVGLSAPYPVTVLHAFTGADGANPTARLLVGADGDLYGAAAQGGAQAHGTLFKIAPDGSGFTTLHAFADGPNDGADPQTALIQGPDGTLYGTTRNGGPNNLGTVFKLVADGSGFTLLHTFTPADGFTYAGVTLGSNGTLYGTTYSGGVGGHGTVYSLGTDGSGFTVQHRFTNGEDGANPLSALTQVGANLYGVTEQGGDNPAPATTGAGTLYELLGLP